MKPKIAIILPTSRLDHLSRTLIDGFRILQDEENISFKTSVEAGLSRKEFIAYAQEADLIVLCWGKGDTDYKLTEEINHYEKTVFSDGSELGRNRRLDPEIQKAIALGTYEGQGRIDQEMLKKCKAYFRREKPYVSGIIPLPFGIEKQSIAWTPETKKDIDFFCVFGQDEYPPLRRQAHALVKDFCKKNKLSCAIKTLAPEEFTRTLARSKFALSISGGGYDTGRFWEILGNNCTLLTEAIDIFRPEDHALEYRRIWQFSDLTGLADLLRKAKTMIDDGSFARLLDPLEYQAILDKHLSKARAQTIMKYI